MERAPLRPLPSRSLPPLDLEAAREYVAFELPELDEVACGALAAVELTGASLPEADRQLGLHGASTRTALARARKALRRSRHPLAGSGWCERAERLISDRLDGELGSPAQQRLDVHLRNCPRCVEHELRLIQALDVLAERAAIEQLSAAAAASAAGPAPAAAPAERPAANLGLAVPTTPALPPAPPRPPLTEAPPPFEEARPAVAPVPAETPARVPAARPEPAPVPQPLADPRPVSALLIAFTWHIAFAIALILAAATIAVTAIGITGGSL